MTPSNLLGDYLRDNKEVYFNLPVLSKHAKPWYSPKVRANIRARKVDRITAKMGMF